MEYLGGGSALDLVSRSFVNVADDDDDVLESHKK